jgi:hypothetical protein
MSGKRWLAALLAAALVVVLLVIVSGGSGPRRRIIQPARPAAPAAPTSEQFGANVNRLFDDRTFSQEQIDTQLAALRATGATIARTDTLWEATEPSAPTGAVHHYDWRFDDAVAGSLARHGLRWLALLDYAAPWARTRPTLLHSPPVPTAFAGFAAAFAARYGAGGVFWHEHPELQALPVETYEVWNEPDNGEFWQPAPDPGAYADLYLATRAAIARVAPGARVVVGGLTKPTTFLPQMLASRPVLHSGLDGVAVHPYAPTPAAVLGRIRHDRRSLDSSGLADVPLYVTEFGWVTHPAGSRGYVPERVRRRYIATTMAVLGHTNCLIAAAVLYTWVTPERVASQHEDWYGIHSPHGGGLADSAAFAAGIRAGTRTGPPQPVCGAT